MNRPALVLALLSAPLFALLAAAPAAAADQSAPAKPAPAKPVKSGSRNSYANPSAVIAAELALAQDAQVRGQWTAFAAAAAPDAVMFTPRMVWAQQWLKGRSNPPAATKWQPYAVWSSCDGSLMVTHGAYQKPGPGTPEIGYYTTIWQRQYDGRYKWVLNHGDSMETPMNAPEMTAAHVADCPDRPEHPADAMPKGKPKKPRQLKPADLPPLDPNRRDGESADGTLKWAAIVDADGGRKVGIVWLKDGEEQDVLVDEVGAYMTSE